MAVNGVEGQSRGIRLLSGDLTVGNQSQLDQRLETVADTQCQSVSLIQKLCYCFLDLLIFKCGCKEFCGSIRLVSCGEAAREHDDLCLTDGFLEGIHGFFDVALT